jgi:hypothetical protein
VAVQISKNNGAFATATNSPATEIGSGWYALTLTAAEMNANNLIVVGTASGCQQTNGTIQTQG